MTVSVDRIHSHEGQSPCEMPDVPESNTERNIFENQGFIK